MSITSGGVEVESAVAILVVIPSHCWVWIFTSAPVVSVNSSLIAFMVSSV
jgi:hypothetical protein